MAGPMTDETASLVHFETADDGLAAYLDLHGVRRMGLGFGSDEADPAVTHVFDDDAAKLMAAVSRYQLGRDDGVSASAFIATYRRLRELREDEELRRRRQARSDWARGLEGEDR